MDLKVELQKEKDAARVAREASEAEETTSYECGVLETETRLAEEVVGVCRDYCAETWVEALNRAGVPTDFELRSAENIFFPEDIREVSMMLPPPVADPLLAIQALSFEADIPTGAGKGKEVQPQTKAKHFEDDLTIRDVVSKSKDAKSKSKAADPKEDHHQAKT